MPEPSPALYPCGTEVSAQILSYKNGTGWLATVDGNEAFLPLGKGAPQYRKKPEEMLQLCIPCLVSHRASSNVLMLSAIELWERQRAEKLKTFVESTPIGTVVNGTVLNIVDYGAFIDLGGFEGLLHASEMQWGRVPKAKKLFRIGDSVTVIVSKVTPDSAPPRIYLSLKQLLPDIWIEFAQTLKVDQRLRGVIKKLIGHRALVTVAEGVEGSIHASDLSPDGTSQTLKEQFSVGQELDVCVTRIDFTMRHLSLSLAPHAGISETVISV